MYKVSGQFENNFCINIKSHTKCVTLDSPTDIEIS